MIALGGAVGSVLRHLITQASILIPGGSGALGTTACNLIGCAAIGAVFEYVSTTETLPESYQLAIRVGLLGGLTTFSTFALESLLLSENGRWGLSTLYVLANLILGWLAIMATMSLVRSWTA
ncbi:MAG: fluoride efflux transporter CrcB [Rubripirellula sp.]